MHANAVRRHKLDFIFDLEIRIARQLRTETRTIRMAITKTEGGGAKQDNRTLLDYLALPNQTIRNAICIPTIEANNFEMQMPLIQMMLSIQFGGTLGKDLHMHVRKFLQLANTIKMNGISTNTIRLILIPFSITDRVIN